MEDLQEIDEIRRQQFKKYSRAYSAHRNRIFDYTAWHPTNRTIEMTLYLSKDERYLNPYPNPLVLLEPNEGEDEDNDEEENDDRNLSGSDHDDQTDPGIKVHMENVFGKESEEDQVDYEEN